MQSNRKWIWKVLGIAVGFLVISATVLHFWFVNNAENIIEGLVESKSKGKLRLRVENMKFNYFSNKIELNDVIFYTTDSIDENTLYRFSVHQIKLRAKAILPILLNKQLLIDSLYLDAPDVQVVRLRKSDTTTTEEDRNISVTGEMGRVYNSIQDAIRTLEVDRFEIQQGTFTLINRMEPERQPFVVTNIHFYVNNLEADSALQDEKVFFSDQIYLRTHHQNITFPDGVHKLAFRDFRINIDRQLIEFDSCTISRRPTGSSKAEFSVYFDTLKLVNLDFKAIYQTEVIKADSVYCLNPDLKLVLEEKKEKKADLPEIDSVMQDLATDMQLGYVGVINADIDITTYKNNVPSSFSSRKNSFEMQGVVIDHRLTQPVSVEAFAMAIRDYENFLQDSSYTLRFDSVVFREKRVMLSNFSFHSVAGNIPRHINVSQFELTGLSWEHLLFNRTIKAREAILYNPNINYTPRPNKDRKKKQNVFRSLGELNEFMELERLSIVNGNIRLRLGAKGSFDLQNAYVDIRSNQLLGSRRYTEAERSVEALRFRRGFFRLGDMVVELQNANFTGHNDQLIIKKTRVYSGRQTINATINDILVDELVFDEDRSILNATNVKWNSADVEINHIESNPPKKGTPEFLLFLSGIYGNNTKFRFNGLNTTVTANINELSAGELIQHENLLVNGLAFSGSDLNVEMEKTNIYAKGFDIEDDQDSYLRDVTYNNYDGSDTTIFRATSIQFNPDINALIEGDKNLKPMVVSSPNLYVSTFRDSLAKEEKKDFPSLYIQGLLLKQPVLNYWSRGFGGDKLIRWNGEQNTIRLSNIRFDQRDINISSLKGNISNLAVISEEDSTLSGTGELELDLEDIRLNSKDSLTWSMKLNSGNIINIRLDSFGKRKTNLNIQTAQLRNILVTNSWISNLSKIVQNNPGMILRNATGIFSDSSYYYRWYNLSFNEPSKTLSLDSFMFRPTLSRDSFVASREFQTDYMTLHTGRITLSDFDMDAYVRDTSVYAGVLTIREPYFTSFRDKRPPFRSGIIKPLPGELIRRIPFPIDVDSIVISDGTIVYSELNNKTKEEGTIPITKVNGHFTPLRNEKLDGADSVTIALRGYLMDSTLINLFARHSYLDSAGGFRMKLTLDPHSLTFLNSVLGPLASIRLKSGYLDTLYMTAIGNDEFSYGEMKFYYEDLKIRFVRKGDESKKGLFGGLLTFIANNFILKKNNKRRTGVIYFERIRDKSFINFYVKTAMSGVQTSIGAKSSRKAKKKIEASLEGKSNSRQ